MTGQNHLYFYDALSPIVMAETIDLTIAFKAGRYDRNTQSGGDYINCPMTREEYYTFVEAIKSGQTTDLRDFEQNDPLICVILNRMMNVSLKVAYQ